ncbi:MAG: thiol:disulfide interchange protein [Gammaproteobacteria bacterium RIFCSPLOWO2_02_FULL_61_13]|nr:MAG: thiol:disulfide interchange protein [Gammaproteobacteria bacterium RIFCSPLOWO2_02_FULL_61_13]
MSRYLIPLLVFIALVGLFAIGLRMDPRRVPSPFIGKPAPAFDLPQLHAPGQRLTQEILRGRPVLLNVWASWCVECRHEHGLLLQLARQQQVPIYGLNYKDPRADALRWLEEFGNPYVISAVDEEGGVGIDYGVYGVPETFVVDAAGIIRYKHIGALTEKAVNETILPLLNSGKGSSERSGP